jgi:hypothetical protein
MALDRTTGEPSLFSRNSLALAGFQDHDGDSGRLTENLYQW